MADDLQALEEWAGALLGKLSPGEQRKLTRQIAIDLRRSQQQRIAEQRNPDGSAYEPRKPQKNIRGKSGRVRRKMFAKIKLARNLKVQSDGASAGVIFAGRVSRIARVHQYGEQDAVRKGGPSVRYPTRVLLGFTERDRETIKDRVLDLLGS